MKKITYNGESKILIALCNSINEIIDDLGNAGNGDMKKSVYDTNGNGIVDNAEKVNNHSVNANVPEDAKFTDSNTTYTLGKSDGKITLTDSDGLKQEVDALDALKQDMAKGSLAIVSGLLINNSGDRLIVNEDGDLLAVRQTIKFNYA